MGGNQQRGRKRGLRGQRQAQRAAREEQAEPGAEPRPPQQQPKRSFRETVESFGGFLTIGIIGAAILVVGLLFLANGSGGASDADLLGEQRLNPPADHIQRTEQMNILAGEPPTGGPHFPQPQRQGTYDVPIEDGNAVHALEHGLIWVSYNPELVTEEQISALEDVADDFRRDMVLSPRPENDMPIAVVSWERILRLEDVDAELMREFANTNRNRSPEPGVR